MNLFRRLLAWLTARFVAGFNAAPYPFDDAEGEAMWQAGKEQAEQEKAVE